MAWETQTERGVMVVRRDGEICGWNAWSGESQDAGTRAILRELADACWQRRTPVEGSFWGSLGDGGGITLYPVGRDTAVAVIEHRDNTTSHPSSRARLDVLGFAHDMNNLLTVVDGHLALLSTSHEVGEARWALEQAEDMVRRLAATYRHEDVASSGADMRIVLERWLKFMGADDDVIETDLDPCLWATTLSESQWIEILQNLLKNALEAMPEGGTILIRARNLVPEETDQHPFVEVTIRDTGVGISRSNLGQVFQPQFSTKTEGQGVGLYQVGQIIGAHGGSIELTSYPGQGTTFTLKLPAHMEASSRN